MRPIPLRTIVLGLTVLAASASLAVAGSGDEYGPDWRGGGRFPQYATYANPTGRLAVYLKDGAIDTRDHPFFRPMGTTGRSCASCHEPDQGMSLSAEGVRARWAKSGFKDPLFSLNDGAGCPSQPAAERATHALLLDRGLVRVSLPWPPRRASGETITPEFTIDVVRDPTGCNKDAAYGLQSPEASISVYRRPRMTGNLRYILNSPNDRRYLINVKTGDALPHDPDSTGSLSLNLMSDGRNPTLRNQFEGAIHSHLPGTEALSAADMDKLLKFVTQIYTAQVSDIEGGNLIEPDGPKGLGPYNLAIGETGLSGEAVDTPVFQRFDAWKAPADRPPTSAQAAFRASVARGSDLFTGRTFLVRNVNHINSIGLGNPVKRSCALCHNAQMTGHDGAPGWMDIGTSNWPNAHEDRDLPLFKLTCRQDAMPHPYLGRVIFTSDPGRALITGKCSDIGSSTIQQLRGLAARAPYFHNGSARTLRDVVDFYDRRFNIGYTEQEKQDLINFLRVL
jgi:hypothetical protein